MNKRPALPKVKKVDRNVPHPNKWWRNHPRCSAQEVEGAGRYRHRHLFEGIWSISKERRGKLWFLFEETMCVYDGCGQLRVRHTKSPYCAHCGQTTSRF